MKERLFELFSPSAFRSPTTSSPVVEQVWFLRGPRPVSIFSKYMCYLCKCAGFYFKAHSALTARFSGLSLIIPLFLSAIFWASNGEFPVRFIDSLFLCVSAATGTGLGTVDLSALTAWQQTILVILQILGSPVTVSWVVVMFRR